MHHIAPDAPLLKPFAHRHVDFWKRRYGACLRRSTGIGRICREALLRLYSQLAYDFLESLYVGAKPRFEVSGVLSQRSTNALAHRFTLLVDANDVVLFEFVWHRAISNAGNHCSQTFALLYEIFVADWVIETLTQGYVAEFNAEARGRRVHANSISGWPG